MWTLCNSGKSVVSLKMQQWPVLMMCFVYRFSFKLGCKKKTSAVLLRFIVNFFPLWNPNSISAKKTQDVQEGEGREGRKLWE